MAQSSETALPAFQQSRPTIHALEHSQAQRIIWALEEIKAHNGLVYDIKVYPRTKGQNPDLAKVSAMGKSPILTVNTLDGKPKPGVQIHDGVLMESRLILDFLAAEYNGKELWEPDTDADKRRDLYFQEFACNSFLERMDQPLVLEMIPILLPTPLKQVFGFLLSPLVKMLQDFQTTHFEHMEAELSDEKPYFSGAKVGIADFCIEFPLTMAVDRGRLDPVKYPKTKAWHDRIIARPAYQKAIEQIGGKKKYDLLRFGL